MCECYKIGGPFIAEDPECPIHGREAQARQEEEERMRGEQQEREDELRERIESLEKHISSMDDTMKTILEEVKALRLSANPGGQSVSIGQVSTPAAKKR